MFRASSMSALMGIDTMHAGPAFRALAMLKSHDWLIHGSPVVHFQACFCSFVIRRMILQLLPFQALSCSFVARSVRIQVRPSKAHCCSDVV